MDRTLQQTETARKFTESFTNEVLMKYLLKRKTHQRRMPFLSFLLSKKIPQHQEP